MSLGVEQLGIPCMHKGYRYTKVGDGHRDAKAKAAVCEALEAWTIASISETDEISAQGFTCVAMEAKVVSV